MGVPAISYYNLQFPASIVPRAIWLYARFNLNPRDVEELLAERGVSISYKIIQRRFFALRKNPPLAETVEKIPWR